MRRKKAMRSRKSRALRWLAALCLLVAACHFTDIYVLTLGHTLERQDQYWLTGRTELDEVVRDPFCQEGGVGVVTASWNDRVVSLGLSRWTPLRGWVPGLSWPVERTGGAVDGVAAYYSWQGGREEPERFPYIVYGIVNDPSVTEVRLTCEVLSFSAVRQEDMALSVEIRTGDDGHRYFLTTFVASGPCDITYSAAGSGEDVTGDIESIISLTYDWPDM